jgi:hypothetical protein
MPVELSAQGRLKVSHKAAGAGMLVPVCRDCSRTLAQPVAIADLIAFLQSLPEGRKRRGVRYPQWLLLLMAILGILSGCRSARDLERFARRHHQAFASALDVDMPKAPCDSTFLYLFERVELEQLFGLLRQGMLAQIAHQNKDFEQLICDGKTLRGSAAQLDGADGATRFVTQVTLYYREFGVAIARCQLHRRARLSNSRQTGDRPDLV